MGRINQEIIEYAFSTKSTLSYDLSLLVGSDSVYYVINDAQLNVLVLKSYHFDHAKERLPAANLKNAFLEDLLLQQPYRTTKVAFTTNHFTLIPSKFYDESNRLAYFQNLTDLNGHEQFAVNSLKKPEAKIAYLIESQLVIALKATFPQAEYFHSFTALITGYQKLASQRFGHQVFANIRDGFIQILFFDSQDLVFSNAFPFQSPQDVIYYIMNVYEQFKLNPDVIPLSISGSLTEDSDIFKFIYRFIRYVSFVVPPPYFRFGQQFKGIPAHFYFDLFSVKLCE